MPAKNYAKSARFLHLKNSELKKSVSLKLWINGRGCNLSQALLQIQLKGCKKDIIKFIKIFGNNKQFSATDFNIN